MNLTLSSNAKEKLLQLKEKNEPIKVKITGFSWGGAEFGIVSEKQHENDGIYNVEGLNIIVDEDIENAVEGLSIDYKEGLFKKDFQISPLY